MSFYRIYRPQIIDEIDNALVRESLLRLLGKAKNDLPHAFLFSGPRGSGKTTAARLIAKLFNCTNLTASGPCGKCDQCLAIAAGRNLDVLELDAASNRGIDEIRALRDGINLAPVSGTHKIYIIDEVHMLTTEAFNALLKTLEEPPAHAVFILATTDPQMVPITIKSRCTSVVFGKASAAELTHALERIVQKEKIAIADDALLLIAQSVDGAFRDAVKYLEQVSFHKGKITQDVVRSILALSDQKSRENFLLALAAKKTKEALAVVSLITAEGKDIKTFLTDILNDLEKRLVQSVSGESSDGWEPEKLRLAIRKMSQAYLEMKGAAIPQLPLELAVVEYCEKLNIQPGALPPEGRVPQESPYAVPKVKETREAAPAVTNTPVGSLTIEKLVEHWTDVIAQLKPYNHSVAGVMRSTRPKTVGDGIVVIEAFYTFHRDKLSEVKTREVISDVLKKLFGETVKVEVVLGKK